MKSGWQYVQTNGTTEKMAPKTLVENVLMSENGPTLKEAMPSNANLLINGDFQVWQRGTSFLHTVLGQSMYTADRWVAYYYSGQTIVQAVNTSPVPTKYTLANYRTSTAGICMILQIPENLAQMAGNYYTLSFWARGYGGYSGSYYAVIGGQYFSFILSSSWTKYEFTLTSPFTYYADERRGVQFYKEGLPSGQGIELSACKLEPGNIATPFLTRIYPEELAMCQRYYENSWFPLTKSYVNEHIAQIWNAGYADIRINYLVDKRIVPTVTVVPEGSNTSVYYYATNSTYYQAASHSVIGRGGTKGDVIRFVKSTSDTSIWTPGQSIQGRVHWEADAEIY
jgi:hypothetical protein